MTFEQLRSDIRNKVKFPVLFLSICITDFDASDQAIPTCSEDKASVIGQVELLDEVTVFALTLVNVAEVF